MELTTGALYRRRNNKSDDIVVITGFATLLPQGEELVLYRIFDAMTDCNQRAWRLDDFRENFRLHRR
jgi:hypothetical protein